MTAYHRIHCERDDGVMPVTTASSSAGILPLPLPSASTPTKSPPRPQGVLLWPSAFVLVKKHEETKEGSDKIPKFGVSGNMGWF